MNFYICEHIAHALHEAALTLKHLLNTLLLITVLICTPVFVYLLFNGINAMILQNSPENLANMGSLGHSFITFLDLHFMIMLGALGITFVIWFFTRNVWKN